MLRTEGERLPVLLPVMVQVPLIPLQNRLRHFGRRLDRSRLLLWLLTFSVLGPQIANQAGWWAAEVGRQPWIVYNLLRTSDALSAVVTAGQVAASMVMFMLVYLLLFAVFLFLLNEKIRHGPDDGDLQPAGKWALGLRPKAERGRTEG